MESSGCERPMNTMTEAVRVLAYVPRCTDAAVSRLETLAASRREAEVLTQLAAAYYIRAQRKDQPADFVRALDAADAAVALAPSSAPARFNRALTEEALGFTADAIASWDILRRGAPDGWTTEAAEHWQRLTTTRTRAADSQWPSNEQRLPEAARSGDLKAIEQLVSPYRLAAQKFVEDKVLLEWARARDGGNDETAAERLRLAEMIAATLAQLTRDRYLRDVVEHIRRAAPTEEAAIRRGLSAFAVARAHELKHDYDNAAAAYMRAEQAFAQARHPMRLLATIKRGAPLALGGRFGEVMRLYAAVETEAKRAGYASILARVYTGRAFAAFLQGSFANTVAEYTDAEAVFARIGDAENVGNILTRRIGIYRLIGNRNLTWREIIKARDSAASLLEPQSRHMLLGESAMAALELGYPRVALRYQNAAIAMLQEARARNGNDATLAGHLLHNLSVALRGRAAIHAHLGDDAAAQRDLERAATPISDRAPRQDADEVVNGFLARLAEVRARTFAGKDRRQAIAALSEGIAHASRTHYTSLMASLLVQRADLHRLQRDRAAELSDLRDALRALRREEQAMLSVDRQSPPVVEQMWSAYFGRYQKTYRHLIQRLVDDGADAEAFQYAERARAFEPLYRILARDDVPADFRARIRKGEPFELADVQRTLSDGTFLLLYAVMDDRTHVWTIWNGDFHRATLTGVGNARIGQWTSALQHLGQRGDVDGFHAALAEPYVLLREPLARIAKVNAGGRLPRVIVVPDRAMHGLPFAALRDGNRHVVEDHLVSVAPSATLYAFSLAKDRQRSASAPGRMLLVADPAFDPDMGVARGLSRLPWARSEARQLETIYRNAIPVEPLLDRRATSAEFLRLAADSSIIHVAAHGVANADIPSRSYLLFAPSHADDAGVIDAEGLLTKLRLEKARLAILAACSSAGGTPVGPEGLAPLVRPLLVAGVPAVVGALWNVSESSATAELFTRFHRHYRDGRDADEALRLAQLEMLGDPELARNSAVAWAPFQATGHASSPFTAHTRR